MSNDTSRRRKKRLQYNAISAMLYQLVAIVSELILPRLILKSYGSVVNGLVNSITQFLGFIAFFELGIGAVVKSALYKPLATNDEDAISDIMTSAKRFYANIGKLLIVYIIILIGAYPIISDSGFDWIYTAGLIVAISISSFAQYFFGAPDKLLVTADQKGFIPYTVQSITFVISTFVCVILIEFGATIHLVKLAASCIYLIRPIYIRIYINRHYCIDRRRKYSKEPLEQKWNGIAQHIAAYILDGTDTIVLTVLSSLKNVSIYGVYHLVVFGINQLFFAITSGVQALLGELWAKKEYDNLNQTFSFFEWFLHTIAVLVYGCTAVLITPFVLVYTRDVTDANYNVPVFGILISLAYGLYCLRMPYSNMILATNQFKETQKNYIETALINICISIAMVKQFGLIGVAIGTLVAMTFQTIWMAWYCSKKLLLRSFWIFIRQGLVDIVSFSLGFFLSSRIKFPECSVGGWIYLAIVVFSIWLGIMVVINACVFPTYFKSIIRKMRRS